MERDFISDIELFYANKISENVFLLPEEETKHALKVLRKKIGDDIYATDGNGNIYKGEIISVRKKNLEAKILEKRYFKAKFDNVEFFLPLLKNKERLRFAFEKIIELGFTRITFFASKRTLPKKINLDKWEKIAVAAMKQSLHANLPKIDFLNEIGKIDIAENTKIVLLAQNAEMPPKKFFEKNDTTQAFAVFIGPEGDFTEEEKKILQPDFKINLGNFRLRSETAVIAFASFWVLSHCEAGE